MDLTHTLDRVAPYDQAEERITAAIAAGGHNASRNQVARIATVLAS